MPILKRSEVNSSPAARRYKEETVMLAFRPWFEGSGLPDSEGNIRAFCPICEDPATSHSPSAGFKPSTGEWNCLKGNHGGSIYRLAADLKAETGWDILAEAKKVEAGDPTYAVSARSGTKAPDAKPANPLPDRQTISGWVDALQNNSEALQRLTAARGFTHETILKWDIGWDGGRYTIPVRSANGDVINIRRYKLGAKGSEQKMLNWTGHGAAQIFGVSRLKHDAIVLTEGETDAILLNQHGIPAVTGTAGAKTFKPEWAKLFKGKDVYICYDVDDAGREGAAKVQKMLAPFAESITVIELPLTGKHNKDVTDFLHVEGHSSDDFVQLMKDSNAIADARVAKPLAISGEKVSLMESMSEALQNETLEIVVSIAGKQQEPFTAPKAIEANCDMSKGKACDLCPLMAKDGHKLVEIRQDDEQIFRFVGATEDRKQKLMKEIVGARCSDRVEFTAVEDFHIEELLVQPSIDDRSDGESQTPMKRTIFSVSTHKSSVNEKRRMVGRNVTDPTNGKLKFMAWGSEPIDLDIDNFQLTAEDKAELAGLFQPAKGQKPLAKCIEIAKDMADNVTHIYGRDYLHVAYDLVWHSVLAFNVGDFHVEKGWLEMMVVGDTRTGKSEIAKNLMNHYRSGDIKSCEGMSFAGVVGGVQQIDGRWHMSWGIVPMNDRRMVVLDEASELAEKGVIEQMSSIRSSGVAQVTKIQTEQTSARTRLVWITNKADGGMLADSADAGIAALRTVVKNNEDIARFDFVTAAAKGEIDDDIINSSFSEKHDPRYGTEASEKLVKWVWSLTRDDVFVSKEAAHAAIMAARDLGSRYVSDPPLIQSENVRFKILRIAAAIAARTFSISPKSGKLLVKSQHIEAAVEFLDMIYSRESIGYARKSRRTIQAQKQAVLRSTAAKEWLIKRKSTALHTLRMVGGRTFRQNDFVQMGGMERDEANTLVRQLVDWRMVEMRSKGDILMTQELIKILRELEDEDDFNVA